MALTRLLEQIQLLIQFELFDPYKHYAGCWFPGP